MKKGKAFIGTSGWQYAHWEGTFYPTSLRKKDQLQYFTEKFNTVELNNSFYHQPKLKNFQQWKALAPHDFVYSVKANRYFTHLKKLRVSKADIDNFLNAAAGLSSALGPILFQLPPRWKVNVQRLEEFLMLLPKNHRYTFEFRDVTWYDEQVFDPLIKFNCAFCIYDLGGHLSPLAVTADFVYVRLHGPGEKYQGSYNLTLLEHWAALCRAWMEENRDVYVYFDNDQAGYAAVNAQTLKGLLAQ